MVIPVLKSAKWNEEIMKSLLVLFDSHALFQNFAKQFNLHAYANLYASPLQSIGRLPTLVR